MAEQPIVETTRYNRSRISAAGTPAGDVSSGADSLTVGRHLLLASFWFSLNVQGGALTGVALPAQVLRLSDNAHKALTLGILGGVASLVGTIAQPIAGVMSDLSSSHWGRRRPFVAGGVAIDVVGLSVMAIASNIPTLAIGLILAMVGSGVSAAAYQAYVPDLVPANAYGTQSGYIGATTMFGTLISFGLGALLVSPGHAGAFYLVTVPIMVGGAALILVTVHEPDAATLPHPRVRSWRELWLGPWHSPDFVLVFVTRALMMLALYALFSFVEYYVRDVLKVTQFVQGVALVAGVAIVAAVIGGVVTGTLSDRVGRKPIVSAAGILMTSALVAMAFVRNVEIVLALGVIFGLALGAFSAVDWALAVDVLPDRLFAAKDLGIWGMSTNLPQAVAPFLGGALLTVLAPIGESSAYSVLFLFAAACAGASSVLVWRLSSIR